MGCYDQLKSECSGKKSSNDFHGGRGGNDIEEWS